MHNTITDDRAATSPIEAIGAALMDVLDCEYNLEGEKIVVVDDPGITEEAVALTALEQKARNHDAMKKMVLKRNGCDLVLLEKECPSDD